MPERRVDLGPNLYLITSERPAAAGCIVMASYAGNKSCQGFRIPAGVTVSFVPMSEKALAPRNSGKRAFNIQAASEIE